MERYTSQDGHGPLPHGMIRLLGITERSEIYTFDVEHDRAPIFNVIMAASTSESRLSSELTKVLESVAYESGVPYFALQSSNEDLLSRPLAARTIMYLGPSAEDSATAMRCLSRLQSRVIAPIRRRFWSRREGQALLSLAERSAWQQLSKPNALSARDAWVFAGSAGVPLSAVLHFQQLLGALATQGRVEHHHLAHALMASRASEVLRELSWRDNASPRVSAAYPPPLAHHSRAMSSQESLEDLSIQLDHSIATVEARWTQLEHDIQPPQLDPSSEADLDAEIAKYTMMLQQMDIMESDLQSLDALTAVASFSCRQAEARTPRASPEVMP